MINNILKFKMFVVMLMLNFENDLLIKIHSIVLD